MELSLKWNQGVQAFLHGVFFIWENLKTKLKVLLTFRKLKPVYISSVIWQKGESQNGCFKETKHAKFSEKRTFLTP